jgi:short-subunit dehydrogenase
MILMMKPYALITGAAGGLGRAFAAECAARGWNLLLTDLRGDLLEPLALGMERLHGVQARAFAADLTEPDERAGLWAEAARLGLPVGLLVNLAGVEFEGPFAERSPAELRALLRLNVEATVELTHLAVRAQRPGERLLVINVSSLAAFYPMPVKATYAASKRFLLDFSRALHVELRGQGVSVTALCPAGLPTAPHTIRRLEAQGLVGQLTRAGIGDAVAEALDAVEAGRAVCIPGRLNRLIRAVSGLVPVAVQMGFIHRRWLRALQHSQPERGRPQEDRHAAL